MEITLSKIIALDLCKQNTRIWRVFNRHHETDMVIRFMNVIWVSWSEEFLYIIFFLVSKTYKNRRKSLVTFMACFSTNGFPLFWEINDNLNLQPTSLPYLQRNNLTCWMCCVVTCPDGSVRPRYDKTKLAQKYLAYNGSRRSVCAQPYEWCHYVRSG